MEFQDYQSQTRKNGGKFSSVLVSMVDMFVTEVAWTLPVVTKASYVVNIFILFCIFQLTYLNCFRKELDKIGSRSVRCWGLRTQNFRKSKINSKKRYLNVGSLFSFLRKLPLFKFPNYPDLNRQPLIFVHFSSLAVTPLN